MQSKENNPKPETRNKKQKANLQFAFIAPAQQAPGLAFGEAGEDEVYVAVAAEDVAAFEVDGEAKGANDAGLGAIFEEGLGNDLIPLKLDEAGVLEETAG